MSVRRKSCNACSCSSYSWPAIGPGDSWTILDFFVKQLGPPAYNQAIKDAHAFIEDKLVDLEDEFYEPEEDR